MRKTLIRKSKRSHGSCHYGGDMLLAKYEHEDEEPVFITSEYFLKQKQKVYLGMSILVKNLR